MSPQDTDTTVNQTQQNQWLSHGLQDKIHGDWRLLDDLVWFHLVLSDSLLFGSLVLWFSGSLVLWSC
ncbi:hypothetical protein V8B55DRAFT_1450445 [Mucor lusitanicus]|uniref:Uncharacterized protein n=1 Tax=Mucor lusitanicus CBS 277.49 TaxID=747725 RepID=A0A168IFQ7_MUCCL|nr:hypothetical protein MUCCIDRAFT_113355 [Mucor lusitanicus CBS 277.49]